MFSIYLPMNKRDLILSLLDSAASLPYTPAAFFLHFDPAYHFGRASVEKHLEYFRYTGMDLVKIQYERNFPKIDAIQRPSDWAKMPFYDLDFYAPQLEAVAGLVQSAKPEALVLVTLYSPFMCAGHTTTDDRITAHIQEDPEAVNRGMAIITQSLMGFVRACIRLGVDGFYMSTQGGEAGRFPNRDLFDRCIRPFDLALMQEAQSSCLFNILHVCDYRLLYGDLSPYVDYPGHIVNASLELTTGRTTPLAVAALFGRPFMGGLDRLGILATGTPAQARAAADEALREAPERFLLAADCTVPAQTPWANLRAAVDAAHNLNTGAN
jgi:uroporphyrinogen decarboxylase